MHTIKDIVKQLIGKSLDAYNTNYTKVVNTRIDNIVAQAGNDNTEIVDARIDSAGVTHTTLNNRILAETKMNDEQLVEYTGSSLSVEDTMPGYLQNIEIKGNTIQNEDNLEDIRSVGDKVEGQELYEIPVLSCGKNLFDGIIEMGDISATGEEVASTTATRTSFIRIKKGINYVVSGNRINSSSWIKIMHYDINKKFIATKYSVDSTVDGFIRVVKHNPNQEQWNFQIEYGTQATPYEPYQEDKLTILSPVQLEKVGDVADRIICKDGVWGVEKRIGDYIFNGSESWMATGGGEHATMNTFEIKIAPAVIQDGFSRVLPNLSNMFTPYMSSSIPNLENMLKITNDDKTNKGTFFTNTISTTLVPYRDINKFKEYLSENNLIVKTEIIPKFIPLPHDQQVKLRTFANKTNISFLTKIEGTIKAQVPKSLGATVNTHTEQINNLNKELDRVKKLEESTVSTVTTESDFTTVEATSNGYFEDVKLEGRTLVNLWDINKMNKVASISVADNYVTVNADGSWIDCHPRYTAGKVPMLKPNTEYTVIAHIKNNTLDSYMSLNVDNANRSPFTRNITIEQGFTGYYICKLNTKTDLSKADTSLRCQIGSQCTTGTIVFNCILLEGDHTQNPPNGYIEGLKSVGQDVDEVSVESVNKNLFNGVTSGTDRRISTSNGYMYEQPGYSVTDYIKIKPSTGYVVSTGETYYYSFYDKDKKYISGGGYNSGITSPRNAQYIRFDFKTVNINIVQIEKGVVATQYTPHQSDKKRLLFYNNETQTWEKPILREWDSIEKHSDGKYYYHQRSGEVVLNGSEFWELIPASDSQDIIGFNGGGLITSSNPLAIICDKFPTIKAYGESANFENIFLPINTRMQIRISKSKLSTQDAQGFKQWLQTNNVTVVYQLAQEKVYECTNIDLITYANETNYIVESGAIAPRTTLKVHNNISNVVSLLQKKVSLLESNMTKYMITQNRMQLASTYSADSVTFKVDYALCSEEVEYNEDLYNLILNNILVGKDNYNYDKMFNMILDYASWNQISWEQFDILVGVMDSQHNQPIEEEMPVE